MVQKIISGGQTGVDRAALDFALENKIPCGGFCPRGRLAEDGIIPAIYPLAETDSSVYEERTEANVLQSDGTFIIVPTLPLTGGTLYALQFAKKNNKPCFTLLIEKNLQEQKINFLKWFIENKIRILNIAGPRESTNQGISQKSKSILEIILGTK